jgi:hypothetical protein
MDGATLFRMISLVPDRSARSQSGSLFDPRNFERAGLLAPFLGWLGPLNPSARRSSSSSACAPAAASPRWKAKPKRPATRPTWPSSARSPKFARNPKSATRERERRLLLSCYRQPTEAVLC